MGPIFTTFFHEIALFDKHTAVLFLRVVFTKVCHSFFAHKANIYVSTINE
jgi:hypothetical protein